MDFHLKQWRTQQHESEEQPSAKMPKLLLNPYQPQPQPQHPSASTASLPLFVPESNNKLSNLSALPDSTPAATNRFPRMEGSCFSLAQWQELELQALIYRLKIVFLDMRSWPSHELLVLQTGYWGRAAMDPEPGRCRRTDGKKWRCSRDVVAGQKYCERHVHRGRNRSRKPVEIPTPTSSTTTTTIGTSGGGTGGVAGAAFNSTTSIVAPPLGAVTNGASFPFSGQSPSTDLLHLNNGSSDSKTEIKGLLGPEKEVANRNNGHILRHFFDDWPRSHQEPDSAGSNASPMNSATCLSISMPENSPSDVSLKLSTGNGEEPAGPRGNEREHPQVSWTGGWGTSQVASMGGPLAEALRSSTSNSSPTSVLHQLPPGSASEPSFVST
ncbi:hypothetical protein GH714_030052 [Hevea brasiliensis]|uniref:Growth-regulating factor n=1 Tax=Hevea brasiliensis TaxID=3981 RepID=A0A6A6M6P3_HEVBR|nr:hypothetical protein GH714_030052 [Hevea brasiliensis]